MLGFKQVSANTILLVVWSVRGCTLLLLAVCIIPPLISRAQKRSGRVFDAVPLDSRGRLVERLKEYVAYERSQEYEKVYELLYDRTGKWDNKKAYSTYRLEAEGRSGVVQEFTPTFIMEITMSDGAPTFNLIGQAKVLRKGRTGKKQMSINARFQDGEWYFSELSNVYLHID